MVIWFVLIGITAAATALMFVPLWRRTHGTLPRSAFDAQIYRDQLSEVTLDAEGDRITPEQASSARTEIARRLLAATSGGNPQAEPTEKASAQMARRGITVFVALAVPIASFGLYLIVGSPHLPGRPAVEMRAQLPATQDPAQAEGAALVERVGEQLKNRPNDLRGWTLYAKSLLRLRRFEEAVVAYRRVTTLAPRDAEMMSHLAEAQIFAAKGTVTPAARASLQATLAIDAAEPRARFYLGVAEFQAGKLELALRIWIALEADSGPNAPWSPILAERIGKLAASAKLSPDQLAAWRKAAAAKTNTMAGPADPAGQKAQGPRGPTTEDVKAAQSMSANDRMAMIRGMVNGLAARLKNEPDDIAGWQRLARSYGVLGELGKAREAYAHLASKQPNNVSALSDHASAIARSLPKDAAIPPELAALGDRILALDPGHTNALWFTGMARAEAGDPKGARERWTRLLAKLDANGPQYANVKKSIEALDKPVK